MLTPQQLATARDASGRLATVLGLLDHTVIVRLVLSGRSMYATVRFNTYSKQVVVDAILPHRPQDRHLADELMRRFRQDDLFGHFILAACHRERAGVPGDNLDVPSWQFGDGEDR